MPGLAWAVRRDWFEKEGIFDYCVVGSGDRVFTYCFANQPSLLDKPNFLYLREGFSEYVEKIKGPDKCRSTVALTTAFHMFHGYHENRQYLSRNEIIHNFLQRHGLSDVRELLERQENGLLVWRKEYKSDLNDQLLTYFSNRFDDNVGLSSNNSTSTLRPIGKRIILSMSTFSIRKDHILPALESLVRQSMMPDEFHIYTELKITDFNETIQNFIRKHGVQLFSANDKIRAYNKFLHLLRKTINDPNVLVITVDDDWVYPSNLIENLLNYHKLYPNSIITTHGRKILKDQPYLSWPFYSNHEESHLSNEKVLILGCGGVLYQPSLFKESVFDPESKTLSPYGDDLWWTIQAYSLRYQLYQPLIHVMI